MGRKTHGAKHHIMPTSIGGPRYNPENIYLWDQRHYFYHRVFRNLPPSVVIKIIEGFTDQRTGDWDVRLMNRNDYDALLKAFDGGRPAEAIDFIKIEFLPIEKKFLRGELPEYENFNARIRVNIKKGKKRIKRKRIKRGPKKSSLFLGSLT